MNFQVYYNEKSHFVATPPVIALADYKFVTNVNAENLEEVFEKMNVVDGDELPVRLRVRSLSVGDVVVNVSSNEAFACDPCGWRKVEVQ